MRRLINAANEEETYRDALVEVEGMSGVELAYNVRALLGPLVNTTTFKAALIEGVARRLEGLNGRN